MTDILVKHLTNKAYGFPRGSARRVAPVALVCVHITGNKRTAAYTDSRQAALDEWGYANRAGSDGPSAHLYIARDGWAIEAIDNRYAAWSNGDVLVPNTDNPGIRRVLALRSRGLNANEGYWEEWENIGHPSGYRINDAQMATMAARLRALSAAKGLPINRETVHGHWEINGIDRKLCPDGDHEDFLNRLIALAKDDMAGLESTLRSPLETGSLTIAQGTDAIRLSTGAHYTVPAAVIRPAVTAQLAGAQGEEGYYVDLDGDVTHFIRKSQPVVFTPAQTDTAGDDGIGQAQVDAAYSAGVEDGKDSEQQRIRNLLGV